MYEPRIKPGSQWWEAQLRTSAHTSVSDLRCLHRQPKLSGFTRGMYRKFHSITKLIKLQHTELVWLWLWLHWVGSWAILGAYILRDWLKSLKTQFGPHYYFCTYTSLPLFTKVQSPRDTTVVRSVCNVAAWKTCARFLLRYNLWSNLHTPSAMLNSVTSVRFAGSWSDASRPSLFQCIYFFIFL